MANLKFGGAALVETLAEDTINGDTKTEEYFLRFLARKLKFNLVCLVGIKS